MGGLCSARLTFTALTLAAVLQATDPAFAQIRDLLAIFNGDRQRAARQAKSEWRRLPPAEIACIDQRLRNKGSSIDALVSRGVKPSAARLIELRSSCREFVEGVQTGTRDAAGPPTPTVLPSNPTEPKDAGVTPPSPAESPKDAGATPLSSAESPKDAGVTPSPSAQSVGRVVEDQVQQGNVELKDSFQQSRIMGWLSKAFLVAVIAMVVLLGIVMYLFTRWRNTEPRTVAVSAAANHVPEKNLEGGEQKAPLDITIGKRDEVAMPVADEMIQLPDQTGPGGAISVRQNSSHSSKVEPTSGEMLSGTASIETFEVSATGGSGVENVAQLARLYAMGTPSKKEFQKLRGLVSHSRN